MAEAPTCDRVLTPNDAIDVLEELLPAQNQSYELGLKLTLPPYEVESVHTTFAHPRQRLLHIIILFLSQAKFKPTWRVIVDALKSAAVHPQLGRAVEVAHFPETASDDDTHPTDSVPKGPAPIHTSLDSVLSKVQDSGAVTSLTDITPRLESPPPTNTSVQTKIKCFEKRFNDLKTRAKLCLERQKVSVKKVVDVLTSMPADDIEEHKQFLKENMSDLYHSSDISELFGKLSLHWNYLSYQLLDYLIREFGVEMEREMETYKDDLQRFRDETPLALFCQSQKRRRRKPTEEFQEVVAEFEWPQEVTLEVVEQFRQEYAYHYCLRECAMMLAAVRRGSFIVTWFIPQCIVKKLTKAIPKFILKKYSVIHLEIAGATVFPIPENVASKKIDWDSGPSSEGATPLTKGESRESQQSEKSLEEEYPFIKRPSEDFFCPVTMGLLVHPHLTSCCGKHLSEESASRIQREKGPCPLCKSTDWSSMLNKHFRREVKELKVYCRHKEKGCQWKGALSDFESHIQSCPFRLLEDWTQEGAKAAGGGKPRLLSITGSKDDDELPGRSIEDGEGEGERGGGAESGIEHPIRSKHRQTKQLLLAKEEEQKELESQLEDLQLLTASEQENEVLDLQVRELESTLQMKFAELDHLRQYIAELEEQKRVQQKVLNPDDFYPMNKNPHGMCVIFNNNRFYTKKSNGECFPERGGAEVDQYNLTQTFRYLRYRVLVKENIDADGMLATMTQMCEHDHSNYDSFVCFISTHGKNDIIYGADCEPLSVGDFTGLMRSCVSLVNKPKIFFVQTCRTVEEDSGLKRQLSADEEVGVQPDSDSGRSISSTIPRNVDFFFGYATPPGKAAYRSRRHGSWYVSELCKVFTQNGYHSSLSSMMRKVNRQVSIAFTKDGYKQCTEFVDRLRMDVHFFHFIKTRFVPD